MIPTRAPRGEPEAHWIARGLLTESCARLGGKPVGLDCIAYRHVTFIAAHLSLGSPLRAKQPIELIVTVGLLPHTPGDRWILSLGGTTSAPAPAPSRTPAASPTASRWPAARLEPRSTLRPGRGARSLVTIRRAAAVQLAGRRRGDLGEPVTRAQHRDGRLGKPWGRAMPFRPFRPSSTVSGQIDDLCVAGGLDDRLACALGALLGRVVL